MPAGKIGVDIRFFDKNVSRDPFSKSTEFNADHYAVLVAHPAPFRKFPEPFLRLVGMSRYYTLDEDTYPSFLHDDRMDMDLFAFIQVADPTKVRVVERERAEGEAKLLVSTVGRVVSLLPVAPARAESELEASVEKLFDEGGSTEQGDSVAGGGCDAEIELVMTVEDIAAGNVTVERPKRPLKKRPVVTDTSGSSHPPKKLRGDHGTSSGFALGGKSPSVLKELLESSSLNVKVGVEAVLTLPLVTSSVSATPERKVNYPADSVTGANLRTIGPAEWFVISSDSSHHFSTNAPETEVDSIIRYTTLPPVMIEAVITTSVASAPSVLVPGAAATVTPQAQPSIFHDSSSAGTVKPNVAGSSHFLERSFQWDIKRDEEIERLKAQLLLKEAEAAELKNVALEGDRDSLSEKIIELQSLVFAEDLKLKDFDVTVSSLRSQNDSLVDQVQELETTCSGLRGQVSGYERLKEQIEEFQDAQMNVVNEKVAKLDADLLEMALHLEEKFYPHLLTTISGRRWLLTHGLKLV
ncbi:hypothetical protein Tco_1000937, partial [Tanacetum coccineum]